MLKREWGAESNGKIPHLFIHSKTATLVPAFAMEDLPLDRIAILAPEFAVKDLPFCRTLMMMIIILPVALYDGCGIVVLVYCLRLKRYLEFPLRLSPIYGCDNLGVIWSMGMFSSCICSTLVSVCAMKGNPIGLLAQ